jgi:ABC-type lipoprotein release transport system permease subunit
VLLLPRALAYGFWVTLKIVLRKTSVFLAISSIVALSTVVTLALLASEYPMVSTQVLLENLKPRAGLVVVEGERAEIGVCWGLLEYGGRSLEVLVVTPSSNTSLWEQFKVKEPGEGSALVGYRLSEALGLSQGGSARLTIGNEAGNVSIAGVVRFNNLLDLAVITSPELSVTGCTLGYKISDHTPLDVILASSSQLAKSLTQWYIVGLAALTVAITLASVKALLDLEGELLDMEAQGAPRGLVLLTLPLAFTLSTLTGVSYGFILSSIVASTLSSYMGLYIPPPPLTPWLLVKVLGIPSLLSIITPLTVGVTLWRFRGW